MNVEMYFPPPEAHGGWRYLSSDDETRDLARMDPAILERLAREHELLTSGSSFGLVVIRNGYLVKECYGNFVSTSTRFDVWSCTKSLTSVVWGIALEDNRRGLRSGGEVVALETPIYRYIPEGHPLSDPRKADITIRQVLSMTSGIGGQSASTFGTATATGLGSIEYALGFCPDRSGYSTARLAAEPGSRWEYSDAGYAHLSLAFEHAFGVEMRDYARDRMLAPIGVEEASWGVVGGSGFIGPHTNAHTGFVVSARELARVGYLMLRRGQWREDQIVPASWVDLSTRTSQEFNPSYGYGWVVNTRGTRWPYLPTDAFAAEGYRSNRCYVVPSLDLVVARVGSGPVLWDEAFLMDPVARAVLDA